VKCLRYLQLQAVNCYSGVPKQIGQAVYQLCRQGICGGNATRPGISRLQQMQMQMHPASQPKPKLSSKLSSFRLLRAAACKVGEKNHRGRFKTTANANFSNWVGRPRSAFQDGGVLKFWSPVACFSWVGGDLRCWGPGEWREGDCLDEEARNETRD